MTDIFTELFAGAPPDPMDAARRAMRPPLPRRFYGAAGVGEEAGGFLILLDQRRARTPGRQSLRLPTRALAEAVAAEWDAQGEVIDPARMPLTRLANTIIDGVTATPDPVAAEITRYLRSDLLCYRADGPEGLVARQSQLWDPVLDWARETLHARFVLSQGVTYVQQPEAAIAQAARAIPNDPWRLGATHAVCTLTGSALLALAVLYGRVTAGEAWTAAHVDEDWNMELWGRDALALERRAFRQAEMEAAATVFASVE